MLRARISGTVLGTTRTKQGKVNFVTVAQSEGGRHTLFDVMYDKETPLPEEGSKLTDLPVRIDVNQKDHSKLCVFLSSPKERRDNPA